MFIDLRERERERERSVASRTHPSGNQTHNLDMCLGWRLNPQLFGIWDDAPTTEPPSQGKRYFLIDLLQMKIKSLK